MPVQNEPLITSSYAPWFPGSMGTTDILTPGARQGGLADLTGTEQRHGRRLPQAPLGKCLQLAFYHPCILSGWRSISKDGSSHDSVLADDNYLGRCAAALVGATGGRRFAGAARVRAD